MLWEILTYGITPERSEQNRTCELQKRYEQIDKRFDTMFKSIDKIDENLESIKGYLQKGAKP